MSEAAVSRMATATRTPSASEMLAHPGLYRRTFETFVSPGNVHELRAINVEGRDGNRIKVVSGYYSDPDAFARDVRRLDGHAEHLWFTLNPLKPDCLHRSENAMGPRVAASTDADVLRRTWLLIDLDPVREAGIPSTNDELAAAIERADAVWTHLRGEGWVEPVPALSGSGVHLLFPIDLAADDDGFVSRVLKGLARRFDDAAVRIDTTVANAGRLTRVYGTINAKGKRSTDRPHRRSMLLGGAR